MTHEENLPIGWLLLRDGHAVPITGLSPDALKTARRSTIERDGVDLKYTSGLNAIVHCFGFSGDFGDYQSRHWPALQKLMADHGLRQYQNLLAVPRNDLSFQMMERKRRALADRIFLGPEPRPLRVFTGFGHDWGEWERLFNLESGGWWPEDDAFIPSEMESTRRFVYRHRTELYSSLLFISDHLLDLGKPGLGNFEAASYFLNTVDEAERRRSHERDKKVAEAFRWFIDRRKDGWIDIIPASDRMVLLKGSDGAYDIVWQNLRQEPPPVDETANARFGLHPMDAPGYLQAEKDFIVWNYFRLDAWDEKEQHEAEKHHYAQGGLGGEDYPGMDVVLERLLRSRSIYGGMPKYPKGSSAPTGFKGVHLPGGSSLFISEMVTVGEFRRFDHENGYMGRRDGECWSAANDGNKDADPVGATLRDALAFCAWKERELGVAVRLFTMDEHRALRPFASPHYEGLSRQDFPWENFPPRHGLEASVIWSEPRFLEPGPGMPESPSPQGLSSTSRKRWIASENYPPSAVWREPIPRVEYAGLQFIDAWDAYEWCVDGRVAGRYWQGPLGNGSSWGEYKNVKVGFRLVIEPNTDE